MKEAPQKRGFKGSHLQKGLDLLKSCIWGATQQEFPELS